MKKKGQKIRRHELPFWYMFVVSDANMLYLESPAGVGFSYSTDPSFYEGVGDSMTGEFYVYHIIAHLVFCKSFTCRLILLWVF